MKKFAIILCTVTVISTACVSAPQMLAVPSDYPVVEQPWDQEMELLDYVSFNAAVKSEEYSRLIILPIEASDVLVDEDKVESDKLKAQYKEGTLKDDDETFEVVDSYLKEVQSLYSLGLGNLDGNIPQEIIHTETIPSDGKSLILKVEITLVDPGSRGMRYALGFGAGAAQVGIDGQILDSQTNEVLVRFKTIKNNPGWGSAFGGDSLELLEENMEYLSSGAIASLIYSLLSAQN